MGDDGSRGRNDLDAIQPILAANGSGGRAVEKLAGRAYFITGGYQGNAEGYRVHAGCLDFCERWKVKDKSQQTYAGTSKREIFDRLEETSSSESTWCRQRGLKPMATPV